MKATLVLIAPPTLSVVTSAPEAGSTRRLEAAKTAAYKF